MLSNETIAVIKSTVPLLQEHGHHITKHFYERLFDQNPNLKHIFNSSNQQDSTQSRALADAVIAYAENIENLEALLPAVERIANKHASLNILPEHYPIVGENLLKSIQSILDLPDNHPALNAWSEAYDVLADVFIHSEKQLYSESANAQGGWRQFRNFVITHIKKQSEDVRSFTLEAEDNKAILAFKAGQYISVKLPALVDGYDQMRQYSLSNWSTNPQHYQITVKQESKGKVSKAMHEHKVGDIVQISAPYGQFTLDENGSKHVFISGGVGITPLFSMLQQAISQGVTQDNLMFIQCCRNSQYELFKDELNTLAKAKSVQLKRAFEFGDDGDICGRLNSDILNQWLADKTAHIYFCGPMPFMGALKDILTSIGFEDSQLHYEVFGPTTALTSH